MLLASLKLPWAEPHDLLLFWLLFPPCLPLKLRWSGFMCECVVKSKPLSTPRGGILAKFALKQIPGQPRSRVLQTITTGCTLVMDFSKAVQLPQEVQ